MLNRIFISYGDNNTAAYYTVEKWLNEAMKTACGFSWINCFAPNDSEPDNSDDNADKIISQISGSSIFIVISDMYHENKKFIDFQIDTAKHAGKYIIALRRWRNLKPVPRKIVKSADEIVNLRSSDLIHSINMYNKISEPVNNYNSVTEKSLNAFDNMVKS